VSSDIRSTGSADRLRNPQRTDRALGPLRTIRDRFLPTGGALLSALLFGSYVMGLLRDRIFARTFGARAELDAYNAAFILPELTLDVLVASGLAAPFIPIFLQLRRQGDAQANEFGQSIFTGALAVMGVAALLLFVFAPQTAGVIAPGFDDEHRDLYVGLFRVMLLTPILFAASLTLGEVLLAERRMLAYGSAPLLYNAGIIAGTIVFSGAFGIFGPAIGAVLGAGLHLGVRLWGLRGSAYRVRLRFRDSPSVRTFMRLMLPKMASHPVEPMTFLFFTAIATSLGAGSVTAVSFARNFQSVPVTVIGVALALAAFPALSAAWVAADRPRFLRELWRDLGTVTVLTTGAALVLFVLSELVIRVFLGGGAFDAGDVALTAATLAAFALSVPLESLTHLLSRAIYATRHTVLQVLASLVAFGVTIGATLLLVAPLGLLSVPIGFATGSAVKVLLLGLALAWRIRRFSPEPIAEPASGSG
jgi:putative peptidoglycan lipid II flippase